MAKKTQSQYVAEYNAKTYDQIAAHIPRGGKDLLKKHVAEREKSLNAYIIRALRFALADDGVDSETIRKICGD